MLAQAMPERSLAKMGIMQSVRGFPAPGVPTGSSCGHLRLLLPGFPPSDPEDRVPWRNTARYALMRVAGKCALLGSARC